MAVVFIFFFLFHRSLIVITCLIKLPLKLPHNTWSLSSSFHFLLFLGRLLIFFREHYLRYIDLPIDLTIFGNTVYTLNTLLYHSCQKTSGCANLSRRVHSRHLNELCWVRHWPKQPHCSSAADFRLSVW